MSIPVALATPLAERTYISALDLFRVGIGPSSSHTVGPLRAARAFVDALAADGMLAQVDRIECVLFGSLGSTGVGHGTPGAVLAGLAGHDVETVTRDDVARVTADADNGMLTLRGEHRIHLENGWLRFAPRELKPRHPNALTLTALIADGETLRADTYYSVGGGFVEHDGDDPAALARAASPSVPYPFATMVELLALCHERQFTIAGLAAANEEAIRGEAETRIRLAAVAEAMNACIDAGLSESGVLPGSLLVTRRAAKMAERLRGLDAAPTRDTSLEWLQAYAIAVNEENAAGGRVVTAPTNGAAGIIPAVMRHALDVIPEAAADPAHAQEEFLLVAGAIGALIKSNASISGAEAGCQGEVGSAASMAAAGFAHLLGGSNEQVENAAEIAMEHSLGLTCDPVAGLVQLPCIERNAIGAGKAVAAARLAMNGDGTHRISFDTVVETMRQTGLDMSSKYKETSEGGLAVNVVEC
ncbi:L-serine ammonia-lyase [Microcella putealis]|uniref:L-serine dehydratase n=1 Tax=Microcella putealis TaxID=337005 RepID=A0A4Q7LX94_9MICO|nr:L-serine ammonia-lyase [Microcella putealis]RZS59616.1 L-serine ammonia-lyase [Microcella putealis]TQM26729.1 L-serine ammonia-lyase [Microcella putealis]